MRISKSLAMATLIAGLFLAGTSRAQAQISINIGPEPGCPYGYYDYSPYSCAPYGYYGPEWFSGGVFIGAGPWFHGPRGFRGHVDNHYDMNHGYRGRLPERGEHAESRDHSDFRGNEMREGHGDGDHRDRH